MNYQQALLIVYNPEAYAADRVRQAAAFILGTLNAKPEEMSAAISATAWLPKRQPVTSQ